MSLLADAAERILAPIVVRLVNRILDYWFTEKPMRYVLPSFNIVCNLWHGTADPALIPPDNSSPCNLCLGRRTNSPQEAPETEEIGNMWLLLPIGTDIRMSPGGFAPPAWAEVPAWSGRYYTILWVDDSGGGFTNEHRFAAIEANISAWPVPYPNVKGPYFPPPPPPPPFTWLFNNQTFGVPALTLTTPITMPVTGDLYAVVASFNDAGGWPTDPLAGHVFATNGVAFFGMDVVRTALYAYGSVGPGIITSVFTAFGGVPCQLAIAWFYVPAGLGITNAINVGTAGFPPLTAFTGLTTVAPANCYAAFAGVGAAGLPVPVPPAVGITGPLTEPLPSLQNGTLYLMQVTAPVNNVYNLVENGFGGGLHAWHAAMLK